MTYKMKKWQNLSTITLLMAGVITLNNGEFRNVDKHQIAVADTNVQTPDYEKLKKTWLDVNYGYDQYDENNQDMKKKFDAKEKEAMKLLDDMKTDTNRTYLWSGAENLETNSSHMTKTYRNIEKIAEAMRHKNTVLKTDENKLKITDAIKWLHHNVYGKDPDKKVADLTTNRKEKDSSKKNNSLNWWDYEIGTPRALTNTLLLMDDMLTKDEMKNYSKPISTYSPSSDKILSSVGESEDAKGGNLVDISKVKLLESVIEEDVDMMKKSIDSFNNVFAYVQDSATGKGRNGFYKDGSYIDHQDVPYTGAYGVVLLEGISQMMPMIKESPFKTSQDNATLSNWIYEGFMPLIYKGEMMDLSRGRAISRENETSHTASATVMKSLLRLSDTMEDSTKAKYKQIVKTSVESDLSYKQTDYLNSYSDIDKMKSLMADSTISTNGLTQQLKIYNDMDRVTYHNKELDFAFGLSMTSKNIARYESINGENLKGWHTGAGMSYLYNSDVKHYRDNFWATADMTRLPGTTTLNDMPSTNTKNDNSFVGGTKLNNKYASIGMDFENQDKILTAKKSYFILNDKIVFIGTSIKSTDSSKNPVTSVENRKANGYKLYKDDIEITTSDVNAQETHSVFLESNDTKKNIGYHFLDKPKITIKKESHTGKWSEINKSQKPDDKKDEYYEVTQKHSNTDDKYAYVLYPGITKDNFKSKASQVTVVKQDDDFHVVKDNESVWAGVNYSDSTQTFDINGTKVEVKAKGMFILKKKDDNTYECSFYNPESTNSASDIESKISMTGYSITNKNTSTSNESGARYELTK
ncbi:MAG: polysaccharide lyase 8 family protein [Staphylococcus aureus]|uniref:polysaccharide lyase 8 family protein n=2 Tax=Staphylococcus aureus TaxID=1280 RepID=UPI0003D30E7F|nr:polysaccharide lyase 8 family protein [Staphylococcus aureus]ETD09128.1 hyaluronate lyase [Staphylococcus aureus subsp. aureus KPL1845]MBO8867961.1 polysaccharide lyase 8 family protein [Staphylococcus aureus]MCT6758449.1 polysaccharide lyase 8 family protein [Staphylococcus aureus]MCX2903611.1 polysaccharide lyase 8 family protein [Staphylococcus aureus]MCX4123960.1 polysaccharide lyase 8 family protein [Staphylococcus aureus]